MDFVPELVYGPIQVWQQANGHFGVHDPILWPQQFFESHRYYVAIPRKPDDPFDPRLVMWTPVRSTDFVVTTSSLVRTFVSISLPFIARMRPLVEGLSQTVRQFLEKYPGARSVQELDATMNDAFHRLVLPSTRRDLVLQVAVTQRYWMLTTAWLDFHVNILRDCPFPLLQRPTGPDCVRRDLIGAITTQPRFVQLLLRSGVPVWCLRLPEQVTTDITVLRWVPVTRAELAYHLDYDDPLRTAFPIKVYEGSAGARHLAAIEHRANRYIDLEITAFPEDLVKPPPPADAPQSSTQANLSQLVMRSQPGHRDERYGPCK